MSCHRTCSWSGRQALWVHRSVHKSFHKVSRSLLSNAFSYSTKLTYMGSSSTPDTVPWWCREWQSGLYMIGFFLNPTCWSLSQGSTEFLILSRIILLKPFLVLTQGDSSIVRTLSEFTFLGKLNQVPLLAVSRHHSSSQIFPNSGSSSSTVVSRSAFRASAGMPSGPAALSFFKNATALLALPGWIYHSWWVGQPLHAGCLWCRGGRGYLVTLQNAWPICWVGLLYPQ